MKSDAGGEEQRSEEEAWAGGGVSGTVFSYRLPIRAWEIAVG